MTDPEPVLHEDDPAATTTGPDGRPVRNLTADEYAATYAEGEPHRIPDDILNAAIAEAGAQ